MTICMYNSFNLLRMIKLLQHTCYIWVVSFTYSRNDIRDFYIVWTLDRDVLKLADPFVHALQMCREVDVCWLPERTMWNWPIGVVLWAVNIRPRREACIVHVCDVESDASTSQSTSSPHNLKFPKGATAGPGFKTLSSGIIVHWFHRVSKNKKLKKAILYLEHIQRILDRTLCMAQLPISMHVGDQSTQPI